MSLRLVFRKTRATGKRKTSAGSWYIKGTYHDGQRANISLKTCDRTLANRLFAEHVAETAKARVDGPKALINFADAYEVYRAAKGENTNRQWLDAMLPLIGTKRLVDFTQTDLHQLAKTLYPGCSDATLKRQVYTPFIAAWNACVDHEPSLADPKRWKSPRPKRKAVDAPDDGYIATLTDAAKIAAGRNDKGQFTRGSRNPERDAAALLFITFTGARTGEVRHVRVKDVDLEAGYVLLRKTKGTDDKPRQVALAPELATALRVYIAGLGDVPGDMLLFPFATRWGLPQLVKRARKRAGLPHYRPHQIGRHAFATRLLHDGSSLLDVQKAGGWDSAQMVTQTYGHLAREHVDRIVAKQKLKPKKVKKDDVA